MDSRSNIIEAFAQFLSSWDEDYIIDFANKGLYKRGLKEFKKGIDINYEVVDDKLICNVEDVSIAMSDDIQGITCSCPAKSVCKHIIIAILYLREVLKDELSDRVIDAEKHDGVDSKNLPNTNDMNYIKSIDIENSLNKLSKGNIRAILFRLELEISKDYSISNNSIKLFNDITIHFTSGDIESIICSNKCKGLCHHKVEAVIFYGIENGFCRMKDIKDLLIISWIRKSKVDIDKDCLFNVKNLIGNMMDNGLSRLPKSYLDRIIDCSVACNNSNLPNLEKMLRTLRTMIDKYHAKDTSFWTGRYLKHLTKIYLTAIGIENNKKSTALIDLIGERRSDYINIGKGNLIGLGVEAWITESNYQGLTCFFYDTKVDGILTYNDISPTYYRDRENDSVRDYTKKRILQSSTMMDLSRSIVTVDNLMINDYFRVSSSQESIGVIKDSRSYEDIGNLDIVYDNYEVMINSKISQLGFSILPNKRNSNVVIVKIAKYDKVVFDKVKQILTLTLIDDYDNILKMEIAYNKGRERIIRAIEKAEKLDKLGSMLLGKLYMDGNEVRIFPITYYYKDNRTVNIHVD